MRRGIPRPSRQDKLLIPQDGEQDFNVLIKDPMVEDYAPPDDAGQFVETMWHVPEGTTWYNGVHGEHEPKPQPVAYGRKHGGLPPDPTVGGRVGSFDRLGWSEGTQDFRWIRQPFRGDMLKLHGSKAHPLDGPVGKTNWLNALAENVRYQFVELSPTPEAVAAGFTFAPPSVQAEWEQG